MKTMKRMLGMLLALAMLMLSFGALAEETVTEEPAAVVEQVKEEPAPEKAEEPEPEPAKEEKTEKAEEPAEEAVKEEPAEEAVEETAEETPEETTEESAEESEEESGEETAEESTEEPSEEPAEESAEEASEESIEEPSEEPAEESAEESAEEVSEEEIIEEIVEAPADEEDAQLGDSRSDFEILWEDGSTEKTVEYTGKDTLSGYKVYYGGHLIEGFVEDKDDYNYYRSTSYDSDEYYVYIYANGDYLHGIQYAIDPGRYRITAMGKSPRMDHDDSPMSSGYYTFVAPDIYLNIVDPVLTASCEPATIPYDGEEHNPLKVFYGDKELKATEYTVEWTCDGQPVTSFVDPGTYTAKVSKVSAAGITKTDTASFTIEPRQLSENDVDLSMTSITYDGVYRDISEFGVIPAGKLTTENMEILSIQSPLGGLVEGCKNVGEYTVYVHGIGGKCIGTVGKTFVITQRLIGKDDELLGLVADTACYNGDVQNPTLDYEKGLTQYDIAIQSIRDSEGHFVTECTDADTYTVTVVGSGNCTGGAELSYTITPAQLKEDDVQIEKESVIYNGSSQYPSVTINGLAKDTDFEVECLNAQGLEDKCKNAGDYKVVVTLTNTNYRFADGTDVCELAYRIEPKTYFSVGAIENVVYDGEVHMENPSVTDTDTEEKLTKDKDYTVDYAGDVLNVTEDGVLVTVTGIGNYAGAEANVTYYITPADVSRAARCVQEFDAEQPTVAIDGLTEGEDFTLSYDGEDPETPGIYNMTAALTNDNYTFGGESEKTFRYTLNPTDVFGETSLNPEFERYSGSARRPVLSIEGLTEGVDFTVTYETAKGKQIDAMIEVGDYVVEVKLTNPLYIFKLDTCFSDTTTKAFKILPCEILSDNVSVKNATYDGKTHDGSLTVTVNGKTLAAGTDYEVTYSGDRKNVTSKGVTVTVTGIGSYTGTVKKTFYIKSKSSSSVTVNATSSTTTTKAAAYKPSLGAEPMSGMTALWGYIQKGASLAISVNDTKVATKNITVDDSGYFYASLGGSALRKGGKVEMTVTNSDGNTATASLTADVGRAQQVTANVIGKNIAGKADGLYQNAFVTPLPLAKLAQQPDMTASFPILACDSIIIGAATYKLNGTTLEISYSLNENVTLPDGAKACIGTFAEEPKIADITGGKFAETDAQTAGAFEAIDVSKCEDTLWVYVGIDVELSVDEILSPTMFCRWGMDAQEQPGLCSMYAEFNS